MPIFIVRATRNDETITFEGADGDIMLFLKPEELGRAIVSNPIDFKYISSECRSVWEKFGNILERLVTTQSEEPQSLGLALLEQRNMKDRFRMIICSESPVEPDQTKNDEELVKLNMKVKLVSSVPLKASRGQKELGCLTQLARICGPQNVSIQIENMGNGTRHFPWIDKVPCTLVWNEEELSWETETEVTFRNGNLLMFVNQKFESTVTSITSEIGDDGVRNVLRAMYNGPGDKWKIQKEMLEQGTFSDLVIVSGNPENGKEPRMFNCHRDKLAEASPVFRDMLQGDWKEAQSRTIKLPESEDAIEAMLHFLYYGGTERIYKTRDDLVLELLQMGHKYDIPNLMDVASFVLRGDDDSLTVETALQTIWLARNLEGNLWKELRENCFTAVAKGGQDLRKQSQSWIKMCQIARKLGPGFYSILNHLDPDHPGRRHVPNGVNAKAKKEDVELIYDFLSSDYEFANYGVVLALLFLGERLGYQLKEVWQNLEGRIKEEKEIDYLVDLFCFARKKETEFWLDLKLNTVKKLNKIEAEEKEYFEASRNYKKMIRSDGDAAEEFGSLKAVLGLVEEEQMRHPVNVNKRRRLN